MANFKFGVTGKDRKALVSAISDILGAEATYMKTPTYAYVIGNITIDKNGTGTGEFSTELLEELAERGFQAEIETLEEDAALETEATDEIETPEVEITEETGETETETADETTESNTEVDSVCIEMPLDGFTPESLDILCKLVASKEPLIKKALDAEALPIKVLSNRIAFPWFKTTDSNELNAYAQEYSF